MVNGRPSFEALQSRVNLQERVAITRASKALPVTYVAFDLLYLDGQSLLTTPVEDRKARLQELVVEKPGLVMVSPAIESEGRAVFQTARSQNLEGMVAKRLGSPYRPGKRSKDWLKVKSIYDADVVVGGWTKGERGRSGTLGALLVGAYDEGVLRYVGAVGTGFTDRSLADVLSQLQEQESERCPFVDDPSGSRSQFGKVIKDPHWTHPRLVAAVEFRELTSAGRLRAPSFKGLRKDKAPEECLFEDLRPKTVPI
jgi:bifunctional non-homologous end joining protein LigD